MADVGNASPKKDSATFSEKEMKLLAAAMCSLKSGAPEIDMNRFKENGGFNTLKTAQNSWAPLKRKVLELIPQSGEGNGDNGDAPVTPQTSKAAKGSKRTGDGDSSASPTKKARTPRKAVAQSSKGTAGNDDDDSSTVCAVKTEDCEKKGVKSQVKDEITGFE